MKHQSENFVLSKLGEAIEKPHSKVDAIKNYANENTISNKKIYSRRLNLYEEHLALIPIEIPNDPKAGNAMLINIMRKLQIKNLMHNYTKSHDDIK